MLREEISLAISNGRFHVWAVETVNEGIELLTGKPAGEKDKEGQYPSGTIHYAIQQRLNRLAVDLAAYGKNNPDERT